MNTQFFYYIDDFTAYMILNEQTTIQNCPDFQEFCQELIAQELIHSIIIDFSTCQYIDSSILGVLIGINTLLMNTYQNKIVIHHPNSITQTHFHDMGLLQLFTIITEEFTIFHDTQQFLSVEKKSEVILDNEIIFQAHQNLIDANPKNYSKFELLMSLLKKKNQ